MIFFLIFTNKQQLILLVYLNTIYIIVSRDDNPLIIDGDNSTKNVTKTQGC